MKPGKVYEGKTKKVHVRKPSNLHFGLFVAALINTGIHNQFLLLTMVSAMVPRDVQVFVCCQDIRHFVNRPRST